MNERVKAARERIRNRTGASIGQDNKQSELEAEIERLNTGGKGPPTPAEMAEAEHRQGLEAAQAHRIILAPDGNPLPPAPSDRVALPVRPTSMDDLSPEELERLAEETKKRAADKRAAESAKKLGYAEWLLNFTYNTYSGFLARGVPPDGAARLTQAASSMAQANQIVQLLTFISQVLRR